MISKSLEDCQWIINKVRINFYVGWVYLIINYFLVPTKEISMFKITNDYSVEKLNFWNSVFLYYSSPHLINRRILSASTLFLLKIQFKHELFKLQDILKYSVLESKINNIESINSKYLDTTIVTNLFEEYENCFSYSKTNLDELKFSEDELFISVRILFPRNVKSDKCVEFVIIGKDELYLRE